jgi:hypothetical protein
MNAKRPATGLLRAVVLLLPFPGAIAGQDPPGPTLARLDALKLDAVDGDVPARHSRSVSRWRAAPMYAGLRAHLAGALGADGVEQVRSQDHQLFPSVTHTLPCRSRAGAVTSSRPRSSG